MSFFLTNKQIERFRDDGFVVVDKLVDEKAIAQLHTRFDRLFQGDFETGTRPDEVNWQEGESDPELTRQICNAWKSDRCVAATVLREDLGHALAQLGSWPGTRIVQDNVISKPPGGGALGYHQDNAYLAWYTPREILTCWIALDATSSANGTLEFVKGSHRWQRQLQPQGEFHNPADYQIEMETAAQQEGQTPEVIHVEVPRGGGSFHHGWMWHGSGANRSLDWRRSLVLHGMRSDTQFVPEGLGYGNGPVYSRYKHLDDCDMDENHFPILWRQDGHRTAGISTVIAAQHD